MPAQSQRPRPPPPAPRPGLSLLLPVAGHLYGPGYGARGACVRVAPADPPPVRCCRPTPPPGSQPHPQPRGPHRFPQAEPPQLLQAGLQPLLQGPLLLPHGVGQLLRGGHRAVGACWGRGHVLRGAGPGCGCTRRLAGSQSHACPDCGPAATAPCHSRKPARLLLPHGPVTAQSTGRPASLVRGGAGCDLDSPLPIPPTATACFPCCFSCSVSHTHTHHPHLFSLVLRPNQSPLGPPACTNQSLSPSPQPDKIFQLLRDRGAKGECYRYLPRQDPCSRPDPQQGKPSSPSGVCPSGPRAQDSWTRGLGGLTHSPDCRMMPLSVSLTSSLLSMAGFWEEGVRRRDRHPSQPRPGHGGGLEFPQLLKEQQKMTEIKPRASRQS